VSRIIAAVGIATSVGGGKDRRARPDATAHSFRHTFVTNAIEAGVPPHVVQQIVGHASGTMTERYTHLSDEAVLTAFAAMGAKKK
jgi:integrase